MSLLFHFFFCIIITIDMFFNDHHYPNDRSIDQYIHTYDYPSKLLQTC
ncbi:hypothetical protein GLYMA_06G025250v4 [Glycine max]|nr:hypothetical protein GLYMA_06G025250v4 [Glycine max]KAH1123850.1 hypothetical protein GYH30_013875 [Glycine max]